MIRGHVDDHLDAIVTLTVGDNEARSVKVNVVIDTGFNGFLSLPQAVLRRVATEYVGKCIFELADGSLVETEQYIVAVSWLGQHRRVLVDAAEGDPLLGTRMMEGCRLSIDVRPNGAAIVSALA